jgi:cell division septum initiation protein DivIVA
VNQFDVGRLGEALTSLGLDDYTIYDNGFSTSVGVVMFDDPDSLVDFLEGVAGGTAFLDEITKLEYRIEGLERDIDDANEDKYELEDENDDLKNEIGNLKREIQYLEEKLRERRE